MPRTEMDANAYLKAMQEEKEKMEKREKYAQDAELMMVSLDTMMSRYRRVVLRFNEKIPGFDGENPSGLKEYGLPNATSSFADGGVLDQDIINELMDFMFDEIPVPDIEFIQGAECWFTEKGFKMCAPYLYDVIMECYRKGFCPSIYQAFDFPPESIVYADEFQVVIDRDKLR